MKNINKILLGVASAILLSAPAYAHEAVACGNVNLSHEHFNGQHGGHTACPLHHGYFNWHWGSTDCLQDSDGDRIPDCADHCPETSLLSTVDALGCDLDTDKDGVPDYRDDCQHTPMGVKVNERGCRLDTDRDGVIDSNDTCPDTSYGDLVGDNGCTTKPATTGFLYFHTGSATLSKESTARLDALVTTMKTDLGMISEIQGHTDWKGGRSYNVGLGKKRANAAKNYLVKRGIRPDRLVVTSFGDSRPRHYNMPDGQLHNRRVEIFAIRDVSDVGGPTAREVDSVR